MALWGSVFWIRFSINENDRFDSDLRGRRAHVMIGRECYAMCMFLMTIANEHAHNNPKVFSVGAIVVEKKIA